MSQGLFGRQTIIVDEECKDGRGVWKVIESELTEGDGIWS